MSNTQNLDELYKDGRIDEETYAINCIIAKFQNEIKELKKENEELEKKLQEHMDMVKLGYDTGIDILEKYKELKKENEELKEWKRNMKLFNGTDGDTDDEEDC